MIKVVFTYKTKTKDLDELMEKFRLSAHEKFATDVTNTEIKMYRQDSEDNTIIVLDIFYNNIEEYKTRSEYENNNKEWQHIWFNPKNKHKEVSVEIFDCIN